MHTHIHHNHLLKIFHVIMSFIPPTF